MDEFIKGGIVLVAVAIVCWGIVVILASATEEGDKRFCHQCQLYTTWLEDNSKGDYGTMICSECGSKR